MNSQKVTYWLALALAAFAFHTEYQRGAFPVLHRAAGRAGASLCKLATKAERTVAMATLIVAQPAIVSDDLPSALAEARVAEAWQLTEDQREVIREQVRAQAEVIRAQMIEHRGQLEEMRSFARQQVRISDAASRNMVLVCPKTGAKVKIHAGASLPDPNVELPGLEITDSD